MKQHDDSESIACVEGRNANEVAESPYLLLGSTPSELAQSTVGEVVIESGHLLSDSTPSELLAQSTEGENLCNEDTQVLDDDASNIVYPQNSHDPEENPPIDVGPPPILYGYPTMYDSNNNFVVNGTTYFSYDGFARWHVLQALYDLV